MGRKRRDGKRTSSGRLSRSKLALIERNPPSCKVIERQDRFRMFMGDSALGHEMSCAGRLMLVGAFDGMELAPEVILGGLLAYQQGYWSNYQGGPKVAAYERHDKAHESVWEDPGGRWFDVVDAKLRDCGHQVRQAVHAVTCDSHWWPDENPAWVDRIINTRIVEKRGQLMKAGKEIPPSMAVSGELACDSDWAMLDLLRIGASALCGAKGRMVA